MISRMRWVVRRCTGFTRKILKRRFDLIYQGRPVTRAAYFACGGIGDVIMTYPAIRLVRTSMPLSRVDVFVPRRAYPAIKAVFDDVPVQKVSLLSAMLRLFLGRYDIAFANTTAAFFMHAELCAWLSARQCFGFRYPDEQDHARLYRATAAISQHNHDIEQNRMLVIRALSLTPPAEKNLFPEGEPFPRPAGKPIVVIHPGARKGYEYKLWPVERYVAVIRTIVSKGFAVRIILGPSEQHLGRAFTLSDNVRLFVKLSPAQLVEQIRGATLFLGNDSGPAHIAAFYNIAAITLIGPADPARTEPRGSRSITLCGKVSCSPCHFSHVKCSNNLCMKSITVDQVRREVEKALGI